MARNGVRIAPHTHFRTRTYVVQAQAERRSVSSRAVERMREVVRLRDLQVSPKRDKARNDDDEHDDDLDHPKDIHEAQAPLEPRAVQEEAEGEPRPSDQARLPVVVAGIGDVARGEQVVPEDDCVTGGPAEEDAIRRVQRGDEVFGTADEVFEIVLLSSVTGESLIFALVITMHSRRP